MYTGRMSRCVARSMLICPSVEPLTRRPYPCLLPRPERNNRSHVPQPLRPPEQVGDVIEIRNRELIAADVVVVESSDPNGLCFVMTANLDGETNLKQRKVHTDMKHDPKDVLKRGVTVQCELPNNRLNTFEGTYQTGTASHSLGAENVLLRGTQVSLGTVTSSRRLRTKPSRTLRGHESLTLTVSSTCAHPRLSRPALDPAAEHRIHQGGRDIHGSRVEDSDE